MSQAAPPGAGPTLGRLRRGARESFLELPGPGRTDELWRRTDFGAWGLELLRGENAEALLGPAGALPAASPGERGAAGGARLASLEQAAAADPALVERHLAGQARAAGADAGLAKLEAASRWLWRGGAFLRVPRGLRVEKPFEITFLEEPRARFSFPRVLVIAEPGAEFSVVERHLWDGGEAEGRGRRHTSVAFSSLVLGEGARVRYFYEQSLSLGATHFWGQEASVASGALLEHYSSLLGAAVHKSELEVRLEGPGARSELRGLLLGSRSQHFDPRTVQWHKAPRSSSDLLLRAALSGRARSIYTGLISIEGEATGCDAYQHNDNLLLSDRARADSTPVLEILTDDVRCKHGATVGPVNPDELFYLCSRGLSPKEATRMLLLGFFEPVLGKWPLESERRRLAATVADRALPRGSAASEVSWEAAGRAE